MVRLADPQFAVPLTAEIVSGPTFSSPKYAVIIVAPLPKFTLSEGAPVAFFDAAKNPLPISLSTTVVVPLLGTVAPTAFSNVIVTVTLVVELAAAVTGF